MKITQTVLKKYASVIGKDNFISGYYHSDQKFRLVIKALTCEIMNLQDKLKKQLELAELFKNDIALQNEGNEAVNKFYVRICK